METKITDTQGHAKHDSNETQRSKRAAAQSQAIKCLQEMCAKEHGTLTITPNGWSFSFPKPVKCAPLSAWLG